jgi:precorrin-2/cobalt-factor-2 C20-methyltransferase
MGCEQAMSRLTLIGTGPGDPELLTLKAARLIAAANVVAFPQKPGEASLAFEIAGAHVAPGAQLLPTDIPMNVDPEPARAAYRQLADALIGQVQAGRDAVYLCEGDPLFYSSAIPLIEAVSGRVVTAIVPGITSITAASAEATLPLALRNEILKVLPAPLPDEVLEAELKRGAAALIKLGRHFDRVRALLARLGRAESAVVVEHATQTRQRITPLLQFAADERPYFSTLLVPAPEARR